MSSLRDAPVVTDEAVTAAENAYAAVWKQRYTGRDTGMRAALEAAAPLLGPRPMPTHEQIEQRIRRVYIDGGAHITHAQEAASEIAEAVLALLNGPRS